ncbi:hypothetical protein O6H91_12G035100 [Diphasiastrum complanatum]|uniref:Uncharacterized protein n=2 Tax=Diphasiastrum complanatum TaxID=34168 RepID=A0ACC2C0K0_DIPCM|nr:hypothetical protein O6H91_12G035100 [Diphasiastrum complanatum]KAJ7535462.1 hypothetical protein O6H91_12G035100 [Diphasiastrum complanatum]
MGDSRNRLYSTRSRVRPMFISMGSAGSRRVERAGSGHVQRVHEIPTHYSSTHPEVLGNNNGFETGDFHTDEETNFASGYARMQGYPEFKYSHGQGHAISRNSLLGTAQNHGSGYLASYPARGMAESGISLFAEGQTMDEFADKVDIEGGLPIFPSDRNPIMTSYTVTGRGNLGEDNIISPVKGSQVSGSVNFTGLMDPVFEHNGQNDIRCRSNAARDNRNFSKLPPYYSTAPAAGACVYPVDRLERENSYKDYTLWSEANAEHSHGVNSTVRSPCKRKISALANRFTGSQSVSSHMSDFPARSNAAISCSANNGRRRTGHSSPNSIFTYSGSSAGQTVAPLSALPEDLRTCFPEEAHFSQERGFLREVPIGHYESLRSDHFYETSMSDETAIQCNQESGSTGSMGTEIEHVSTNLRPGYRQTMQVETTAFPVDLWSSRTLQSVAPSANLNLTSARFAHVSSAERVPGSHGGFNNPILSCGRGNSSLQVTNSHLGSRASGNIFDDNHSTFRIGQMRALNQIPNEEVRANVSAQNLTMNRYSSESTSGMNSLSHPSSSMNLPSNSSLSDYQIRRVPPCPPWAQSRQLIHSMTIPAYSLPVPRSTSMVPLADPHSNSVSTTFRRHPSSAHFFRGPPIASSVEDHNERLPSAFFEMPVGLPLQRIYRFQASDDHHAHISGGVTEMLPVIDQREREEEFRSYEQMLMLEATTLFGGIGLQDQYSDWRLDVDNMSYEDLLALEERIGNVCTGVTEDVISKNLIRRNYSSRDVADSSTSLETEVKCSICQEEYEEGDDLGRLECGHSYHAVCVKQWLVQKNQCPVCKASAFS